MSHHVLCKSGGFATHACCQHCILPCPPILVPATQLLSLRVRTAVQCFSHFTLYLKGREELVVTVYHGDPTQHRPPPLARITLAGCGLLTAPMLAAAAGHHLGSSSMGFASLCWEQHRTWRGALCWWQLCGAHVRLVLTLALPCLRMQVWYHHSSAEPPSSKPSNA